jgi:hypothetical protein
MLFVAPFLAALEAADLDAIRKINYLSRCSLSLSLSQISRERAISAMCKRRSLSGVFFVKALFSLLRNFFRTLEPTTTH